MSLNNKVIWSEGLFLRPQHFQQQDRFHERNLQQHLNLRDAYRYGLASIQLDVELLKFGKIGIAAASGIFEDGTFFDLPKEGPLPAPIDIRDDCKDTTVYLILPVQRPGMPDMTMGEAPDPTKRAAIRYRSIDQEVADVLVERDSATPMKVAQVTVSLELQDGLTAAYVGLPVARVVEKRIDGQVVLDENFVPVCIDLRASRKLRDMTREVHGLLRHRHSV